MVFLAHLLWEWWAPIAAGIVLGIVWRQARQQWLRRKGEPPLFGGSIPWLGHALTFGDDYASLLRDCAAKSAQIDSSAGAFTLYIAGKRMTFVTSPLDFSVVLRDKTNLSFGPISYEATINAFGARFAPTAPSFRDWTDNQSEPQWEMMRGDGLGDMLAAVHAALGTALDTAVVGAARTTGVAAAGNGGWTEVGDMYSFITGVVWDATVKAMFGDEVAGERQAFLEFDKKFPLLIAGAPPGAVGATAAIETLRKCFARPSLPGDVSELIEFRQTFLTDNFTPHNRESLQVGILWGSVANTMPTAFWAIFWAAKTPEVLEKCVVEATNALAAIEADESSIAEAIAGMNEIEAVVSEVLRIYTASITVRRASAAFQLGVGSSGVTVRKGDTVVVAPVLTHHDPEIYPEPDIFRPARMRRDAAGRRPAVQKDGKTLPSPIALQPFGGGVSMCPGRLLAAGEIKLVIAHVLGQYDIEVRRDTAPATMKGRAGLGVLSPAADEAVPCRVRRKRA